MCVLGLAACQSPQPVEEESGAVQGELRPVSFSIPTEESIAEFQDEEEPLDIQINSAPDISARNHKLIDIAETGYDPKKEPIRVQLLNYWDDNGSYFANINFRNTGAQILKTVFVFGYDRLGRLVSTQANQTFFREKANIVRTLRFGKRDRAVRWTVVVKN